MPADQAQVLRTLHQRHAPELWRYVSRLTRDPGQAEDVVQEVLFRLWQRPAVLERPEPAVRAWLFTVARNLVLDEWRSARRRHEVGAADVPDAPQEDATDRVLDTWLISEALAGLSGEHREVVLLGYFRAATTKDIARQLGIPEGTVKSRMHYALRALRLALQEKGVTE
ncbi:MAG: polymerase sigma factor [Micrococcaceae bacterium]|jgi:RNA polymerase sigma-70 factor (ECF subfamily)|nr:polymerase sigma factor [Micrococcaceae bacterium]